MHPNPTEPNRDYQLALWLSKQCLGIAEGLKMIHTADKPALADPTHDSTYQLHGRHGDLKPENILWFKPYLEELREEDQSCRMGLLKISDFGLTSFHRTISRSHIDAGGVPVSPTYRAPEYDVAKMVSQSYDIWSFGCVVLQFVTWYLLGWEEVDRFSQNRTDEDNSEVKEDVFFNFVIIKDESGRAQTGAIAKQSVADVSQPTMGGMKLTGLRNSGACAAMKNALTSWQICSSLSRRGCCVWVRRRGLDVRRLCANLQIFTGRV
jgi:serine/threonine protein kinase